MLTRNLELLVLDGQEAALPDLVAAGLVRSVNGFAGNGIDELLAKPIAGVPIDLAERCAQPPRPQDR